MSSHVSRLRCDGEANPLGVSGSPLLTWRVPSASDTWRIQVTEADGGGVAWDSGERPGPGGSVRYEGPALEAGTPYLWRVCEDGVWSDPAAFETGLLAPGDWSASWVERDETPRRRLGRRVDRPCPLYRKAFEISNVSRARLYITCHGLYQAWINGQPVTTDRLRPGLTNYAHRLQYQTYDVAELLENGQNAIGVEVGEGWYRGRFGALWGRSDAFGTDGALLAQLEIVHDDGTRSIVATNTSWRTTTGGRLVSDLNRGEVFDARREPSFWATAHFDDEHWSPARWTSHSFATLVADLAPPCRVTRELVPVDVTRLGPDSYRFDLGQNMAGHVRLRARSRPGGEVTIRYAELLNPDGSVDTSPFMRAQQQLRYTFASADEEVFEPAFIYHGFRYVQVDGAIAEADESTVTGVVVGSDLEWTGSFSCSHEGLNQLQSNIQWSQRSNLVEVPTDCPHREKAGYTGDLQAYIETATFNQDVYRLLSRWLMDVASEQGDDGRVRNTAPRMPDYTLPVVTSTEGSAGWGDAATVVPWVLYRRYGDTEILARQYESMRGWVEFQEARARRRGLPFRHADSGRDPRADPNITSSGFHFGDWLSPDSTVARDLALGVVRPRALVATAFHARSADILAKAARVLGHDADADHYAARFDDIGDSFRRCFVDDSGRIDPDRQSSYVFALAFGLLDDGADAHAAERLAQLVRSADHHPTTGFLATPYLLPMLSDHGYSDDAYRLVEQTTSPSWLAQIDAGATTIWEQWEQRKDDGTWTGLSYNHYAFGSVGDWLYRYAAGLDIADIGLRRLRIHPYIGGTLTHASAEYDSVHGRVSSSWRREGTRTVHAVTVAPTIECTMTLAAPPEDIVTPDEAVVRAHATVHDSSEIALPAGTHTIVVDAVARHEGARSTTRQTD